MKPHVLMFRLISSVRDIHAKYVKMPADLVVFMQLNFLHHQRVVKLACLHSHTFIQKGMDQSHMLKKTIKINHRFLPPLSLTPNNILSPCFTL
jgi:hypothetical protein